MKLLSDLLYDARILEVRIADEASDTEAQAARDAAARLQEVVREADTEAEAGDKSPREALESLGRELAFRPVIGPLVFCAVVLSRTAETRLRAECANACSGNGECGDGDGDGN